MFHTVKSVTPQPDFILLVNFTNGEIKQYDIKPLFDKWQAFQTLEYVPELYGLVKVEPGGFGISWNDDIDLACDELYYNGKQVG